MTTTSALLWLSLLGAVLGWGWALYFRAKFLKAEKQGEAMLSRANAAEESADYWQGACVRSYGAASMTPEQHAAMWDRIYKRIAVKPSPVWTRIAISPYSMLYNEQGYIDGRVADELIEMTREA